MKRLTFLLIATALFNLCFAQGSSKTGIVTKDLTVTGTIKNLDEFRSLVIPGTTCIQLVKAGGKTPTHVSFKGIAASVGSSSPGICVEFV